MLGIIKPNGTDKPIQSVGMAAIYTKEGTSQKVERVFTKKSDWLSVQVKYL